MKMAFIVAMCMALLGLFRSSFVFAEQKTAKICQQEWRANRASNQAKGITEKAYVDECQKISNATQPSSAPKVDEPMTGQTPTPEIKDCPKELVCYFNGNCQFEQVCH
jgi:hypothetical protein